MEQKGESSFLEKKDWARVQTGFEFKETRAEAIPFEMEAPIDYELDNERDFISKTYESETKCETIEQLESKMVLQVLKGPNYTEQIHEYKAREPIMDLQPVKGSQVSRLSLIQDGQDILEYLRLNRYHKDMQNHVNFDIESLEAEFKSTTQSEKEDAELIKAVERLRLIKSHLQRLT
jgi:hypothetical protein